MKLLSREDAKRLVGTDQALDHLKESGEPANLMNGATLSVVVEGGLTGFLLEGTQEQVDTAFDHLG